MYLIIALLLNAAGRGGESSEVLARVGEDAGWDGVALKATLLAKNGDVAGAVSVVHEWA